jgi:hypothetical protein
LVVQQARQRACTAAANSVQALQEAEALLPITMRFGLVHEAFCEVRFAGLVPIACNGRRSDMRAMLGDVEARRLLRLGRRDQAEHKLQMVHLVLDFCPIIRPRVCFPGQIRQHAASVGPEERPHHVRRLLHTLADLAEATGNWGAVLKLPFSGAEQAELAAWLRDPRHASAAGNLPLFMLQRGRLAEALAAAATLNLGAGP